MTYSFENDEIKKCDARLELRLFFIGVIVLTSLVIINEIAIIYISIQGTVMNSRPRQLMPVLLYIQLGLYLPELLWTILGTYWAVKNGSSCQPSLVIAVYVSVTLEWLILLVVFIGVLVLFDPLGTIHKDPFGREFSPVMQESTKEVWNQYLLKSSVFPTSRKFGKTQNSWTNIYLSNRHYKSLWYKLKLFIQLIYYWLFFMLPCSHY